MTPDPILHQTDCSSVNTIISCVDLCRGVGGGTFRIERGNGETFADLTAAVRLAETWAHMRGWDVSSDLATEHRAWATVKIVRRWRGRVAA